MFLFPFTFLNILPDELINKILYEHKGLSHPNCIIIKEYINNCNRQRRCFKCKRSHVSLSFVENDYVQHHMLNLFEKKTLENNNNIWLCWNCAH